MTELWSSPFFGLALSIFAFWTGVVIQRNVRWAVCNPLLIGALLVIGTLLVFQIPYEAYNEGGSLINLMLTPATACLGMSIYEKLPLLRKNWLPILAGCTAGSASSMGSIYLLCRLFGLDREMLVSLLPKSVTTAIATSLSASHGGVVSITMAAMILTGIASSIGAPLLVRVFRVKNPVAAGLAIGACSHAVGTSRALEMGEVQGAMSGLAIGICAVVTILLSLFVF
ncbi:LrgB family protein [uncultured Flavonifractor sp.]|uniref:LrgB family protein n=1 Tax=uncultured Flavonifractor sp. TaxID=1193534 RepID=UPI002606382E|nr:LrgB family protein [uncultured Flavonifractor sp.]